MSRRPAHPAVADRSSADRTTRKIDTFPTVRLPSCSGGLPVEVILIAQIGIGAGSPLIAATAALQRGHDSYVDALDEPSARIGGTDFERGDASSLYSFVVGAQGHPFHRHAGHRVFTAISGSGGALLRFSTASTAQIERDPRAFVDALRHVEIPPDSLFTVRFGGGTWHQFLPLDRDAGHPALFALSCHTNELGGDLAPAQRAQVLADAADIPTLTETLPDDVAALLPAIDADAIPTVALSLKATTTSMRGRFCARTRRVSGRVRGALARWRRPVGFLVEPRARPVRAHDAPPAHALLRHQFADGFDHQDHFTLQVPAGELPSASASALLVLKWVGGAYLVWLGIQLWRAPPLQLQPSADTPFARRSQLFRQGLFAAVSNPKALLFYGAFLPQFLDPARSLWPQFAVMAGTFAAIECVVEYLLARMAHRIRPVLEGYGKRFNRICGGAFAAMGVALPMTR